MEKTSLEGLRSALAGRYVIERELGAGGTATVYLAQDLRHERRVAIKVLEPTLARTIGTDRFLNEIRVAARLNHPHIVPLHDSGEADGLLYYVMPWVQGESLQDRLKGGPLPVAEAIRIAAEVASALSYAHAQGVLHRDIKPGNILLTEGFALVADFGLAKALVQATVEGRITSTGMAVGTVAYMAPEQGAASKTIDARADIYSLGCVLFEMLGGRGLFPDRNTLAAQLAAHAGEVPSLVRTLRPEVSAEVEAAVAKSLEKEPEERFSSAFEFAKAFAPEISLPFAERRRAFRPMPMVALLLVAVLLGVKGREWLGTTGSPVESDTTTVLLFPFENDDGIVSDFDAAEGLRRVFAGWGGIEVVDPYRARERFLKVGAMVTESKARQVARDLGAGRYVRGRVTREGDELRIEASLYDVDPARALATSAAQLPSSASPDSIFEALGEALLFRGTPREWLAGASRSVPARQAYIQGRRAIAAWDLEEADSALSTALRYDTTFAETALTVAQIRWWRGKSRWDVPLGQALTRRSQLSTKGQKIATALKAVADGDYPTACSAWRDMVSQHTEDFASWYSLGACYARDPLILGDPKSPSGFRFRSSYQQGIDAYLRAFAIHPPILMGSRGGGFAELRRMLYTSSADVRSGSRGERGGDYVAHGFLSGDSIAFVPWPEGEMTAFLPHTQPPTLRESVARQRAIFNDVVSRWRAASPDNPFALEARALGLEMQGHLGALDSLRTARRMARTSEEQVRLATTEAFMLLRQGIPDDHEKMRRGLAIVDTLLDRVRQEPALGSSDMAALAGITGRVLEAARLIRVYAPRVVSQIPQAIGTDGLAFLYFAAAGGPHDSVLALSARIDEQIQRSIPNPMLRLAVDKSFLGRAATLLYPEDTLPFLERLSGQDDYLIDAQVAAMRGNATRSRDGLSKALAGRRFIDPSEQTIDGLFPESKLLLSLGDTMGAAAWLDPHLAHLREIPPHVLSDAIMSISLAGAMAFRAELAAMMGDSAQAKRWSSAVLLLWTHPDPFLVQVAQRMRQLDR